MGFIERVDRPKPWRARYRAPDGRTISKSFRRKADAEKWLQRRSTVTALGGESVRSTVHIRGHPVHPMLIPFPIALLTAALPTMRLI